MVESGFSPNEVTVAKGETVIFVNKTAKKRWPASDVHPSHTVCSGFDATKPVEADESYSFTFLEDKPCPFHDHLNPGMKGTVTVK